MQDVSMIETSLFKRTTEHALSYLESLNDRPVCATATVAELRAALSKPLPDTGIETEQVIDELVHDCAGGLLASPSGRFFGWVIGGTLPAALAADWLASAWDQNAAIYACSPAAAVVEEVCGEWLKELLGIPRSASFALVTGCQMAHTTALAAARHKLLAERDWDVEHRGLIGAPPIRVLTTENRHETLLRAVRLLGLGGAAIEHVGCENDGRMRMVDLDRALQNSPDTATILCLQAGDLQTGLYDPFTEACGIAHGHGAWVHIDGAFGLWAATSDRFRHLLSGAELADSWATDAHKWLNVPYDCGLVFVAEAEAHRASMEQPASYRIKVGDARDQVDWNPEWSRRARGFPVYAAIRSLGRHGIAVLVERCCQHAQRLVTEIGALPGAEVVAMPQINQGLVRFLSPDGDHDRRTDAIIEAVRAKGVAWFGGTLWHDKRVMRVSVCNWRTSDEDVDRAIVSVRQVLAESA
jgi:glutamate/tyrosine decarboxylase-like PLP-dependent enzyme